MTGSPSSSSWYTESDGFGEAINWMATKIETERHSPFLQELQERLHCQPVKDLENIIVDVEKTQLETMQYDADKKIQEMECMFMEMDKDRAMVVLDLACTKCMGSQYACNALQKALQGSDIKCRYIPSKGSFRFGNGEREPVHWCLELLIPQGNCNAPLKTTIDVIEKGKTSILWSLPQMENLEFDFKCRKGKVYLSCGLFGWQDEILPRSTTNHCCLDILWSPWKGAKLNRPKHMACFDTTAYRCDSSDFRPEASQPFVVADANTETESRAQVHEAFPGNAKKPILSPTQTTCPACRGKHEKHTYREDCLKFGRKPPLPAGESKWYAQRTGKDAKATQKARRVNSEPPTFSPTAGHVPGHKKKIGFHPDEPFTESGGTFVPAETAAPGVLPELADPGALHKVLTEMTKKPTAETKPASILKKPAASPATGSVPEERFDFTPAFRTVPPKGERKETIDWKAKAAAQADETKNLTASGDVKLSPPRAATRPILLRKARLSPEQATPRDQRAALGRVHDKLRMPEELLKLHLKHHLMCLHQLKKRTSRMQIPEEIYKTYDAICKSYEECKTV